MTVNRLRQTLKKFPTRPAAKFSAVLLVLLMFIGDAAIINAQQVREDTLEPLFIRAILDFDDGKYREVTQTLNSLISFLDSDAGKKNKRMLSNIYILLGATCEKTGRVNQARKHYLKAKTLVRDPEIKGLDLSYLTEYQRVVMDRQEPVKGGVVIEKPVLKKKKRRSFLPWLIGGAVVIGIVVAFLLKKKGKDKDEDKVDPDYDYNTLGIEWVIAEGTFMMGDSYNEGQADERPVHEVQLTYFHISKYEISLHQYQQFCNDTGHPTPDGNNWGHNAPVVNVTYGDARAFCAWLSGKTGKSIQLPTEAQWEFAARGTSSLRYPWGESPPNCDLANHGCIGSPDGISSRQAGISPFRAHNMAGNAAEWCIDHYSAGFYSNSPKVGPINRKDGIGTPGNYVIRGGSWDTSYPMSIRSSDRHYGYYAGDGTNRSQSFKSTSVGFRIVWMPDV